MTDNASRGDKSYTRTTLNAVILIVEGNNDLFSTNSCKAIKNRSNTGICHYHI